MKRYRLLGRATGFGAMMVGLMSLALWGCQNGPRLVPRSQVEGAEATFIPRPVRPIGPAAPTPGEADGTKAPEVPPEAAPGPPSPETKAPPTQAETPPEPSRAPAAPTNVIQELVGSAKPDVAVAKAALDRVERDIDDNRPREAREGVEEARAAITMVVGELPSVLGRQYLRRAVALARGADTSGAKKAIDSALALAGQLNLATSVRELSRDADQAVAQLDKGDIDGAASTLAGLAKNIQSSETEELAYRVLIHLEGIERALDMGSLKVAAAELDEAHLALWRMSDLLR